jgi:type I restriction enzyme S subunit
VPTIGKGYKQTEIGAIPEDWTLKKLQDILLSTQLGGNYQNSEEETSYPLIKMGNIERGNINLDKIEYIEQNITPSERDKLNYGDVLFNTRNTLELVGKVAIWKDELPLAYYNSNLMRFKFTRDVSNFFMNYVFNSRNLLVQLKSIATGTTSVGAIYTRDLLGVQIPLPELEEQNGIAHVLSDTDELIESLNKLIKKKKNIKHGAMQKLLTGKKRLPEFDKHSNNLSKQYRQTEFGKVPKEWKLVQLKNIVEPTRSIRYGIVQPGNFDPNGRYMIRGQDYSKSKGWARPSEVFRVSAVIEKKYKNARVKTGDIIITIVGAYCGHVDIIPEWLDGANLTQTTARISIDDRKALNKFCKYQLESSFGKLQVAMYLKGAAQPGLNCEDVENFVLALPSIPEQSAIAQVLSDMDSEIEELEQKRDKYRQIKTGMMQQLLTGRIRLNWKN